MSKDLWLIFYIAYGIAALLMLVILIQGLVKGWPMKKIGRELARPLGMIVGSLVIWYAYLYVVKELGSRF